MNKKITIYELLRLVKDGKAPKMIRYFDKIFTYNDLRADYLYIKDTDGVANREYLTDWIRLSKYGLNDTVEIIEDNDKLENNFNYIYQSEDEKVNANFENIKTTLKDIVDHINKIEEKLDER